MLPLPLLGADYLHGYRGYNARRASGDNTDCVETAVMAYWMNWGTKIVILQAQFEPGTLILDQPIERMFAARKQPSVGETPSNSIKLEREVGLTWQT